MLPPQMSSPYIEFHFEGIVILRVKEGESNFDVGIIKGIDNDEEIPNHKHSVTLTTLVKGFPSSSEELVKAGKPVKVLNLAIEPDGTAAPSAAPSIGFFRSQANAFSRERFFDFNWVVDLEGDEMFGQEIQFNPQALRSVLRVTGIEEGIFYSESLAEGPVFYKYKNNIQDSNETDKDGRIDGAAEGIKALVKLPLPARKITLRFLGTSRILEYDQDTTFKIEVMNDCSAFGCPSMDVTRFYNDLIVKPTTGKLIVFKRRPTPRPGEPLSLATPATMCKTPRAGKSASLPDPI